MPALLRRPAIVALLIALAAQLLFSVNLTRPTKLVFDEVHYVPAARTLLARQLMAPVRWTEVVRALASDYPDALYAEVGPGTVLAGLMKKCVPGAEVVPCGTAAEVDALLTRLA